MPSPFAALEDAVSEIVDAHFGESFELRPMVKPANGRAEPDHTRPSRIITGIFDAQSGAAHIGSGIAPGQTSAAPWISIDEREHVGLVIKNGDRLRRVDTGEIFEVIAAPPDGMGRTRYAVKMVARE